MLDQGKAKYFQLAIQATPFFLPQNWYGHGRTSRTSAAGPEDVEYKYYSMV